MKKTIIFIIIIAAVIFSGYYFLIHQKNKIQPTSDAFPQDPPFDMPNFTDLTIPDRICNIKDFGAKENGFLNTRVFADAISECAKNGGGHVVVPEGQWLTGAIHLASNIDLHLEKNATILFSQNPTDYLPVVFTRFEGIELMNYSPFIYANNCENVSISGVGTLNGQGENWLKWKELQKGDVERLYEMAENDVPPDQRIFANRGEFLRPSFVEFVNCRNVQMLDFTLENSPMWSIHPLYSENVLIRGIHINITGHNTDGIVIDSSKCVLVDNVDLETGDDSISIKSGLDKDGRRVNRPTENVVIQNSKTKMGHSNITIGSEMSGGVNNVYISNCVFSDSDQGIRIKSTKDRGGYVENFWVRDIAMNNINNAAIQLDMLYDSSTNLPDTNDLPIIKNIFIQNVTATGNKPKYALQANGLSGENFNNVWISNLNSPSEKGVYINHGQNINLDQLITPANKKPYFRFLNADDTRLQKSICERNDQTCVSEEAIKK